MLLWYVRLAVVYALLRITVLIHSPVWQGVPQAFTHNKSMLSEETGVPPKGTPLIQKLDTSLSTKAYGAKSLKGKLHLAQS